MSADADQEFGRLRAHEKFSELIGKGEANGKELSLSDLYTLVSPG